MIPVGLETRDSHQFSGHRVLGGVIEDEMWSRLHPVRSPRRLGIRILPGSLLGSESLLPLALSSRRIFPLGIFDSKIKPMTKPPTPPAAVTGGPPTAAGMDCADKFV